MIDVACWTVLLTIAIVQTVRAWRDEAKREHEADMRAARARHEARAYERREEESRALVDEAIERGLYSARRERRIHERR